MKNNLLKDISQGKIEILREGREAETKKGFYAPATITLIKEGEDHYLIDSGCFGEENNISSLLGDKGLTPKNITKVFITHNHPDHIGNIELFRNARIYLSDSIFRINQPNYFELMPNDFYTKPGKSLDINLGNMQILSTPGHAGWDFSVLCHGKNGRILIAGDLFWSQNDWKNDSEFLELCVNPELQKESREHIREKLKPEIVIPGHGGIFIPRY